MPMAVAARLVLAARIRALRHDLVLARQALTSPTIREDLRDQVNTLFSALLDREIAELDRLSRSLAEDRPAGRGSLEQSWETFRRHADDCDRVLKEYLAFVEGALVRTARLDAGICDVADALLRQLVAQTGVDWTRFTILADSEFFAPMTDIIRLRYPHFSVWTLPVVAHEFGHFVASRLTHRLRGTKPLDVLRRELREQLARDLPAAVRDPATRKALAHLDEFFADAFAVYALGPAYACACVLLRFDPERAFVETDEHPSDDSRAYLLFRLLHELSPHYRKLAGALRATWQDGLTAAGRGESPAASAWLDRTAAKITDVLSAQLTEAAVQTEDWARASEIARTIATDEWDEDIPEVLLRDVLNGSWIARINEEESDLETISTRALELCRRAATRKATAGAATDDSTSRHPVRG
jgi:hypothetical protein